MRTWRFFREAGRRVAAKKLLKRARLLTRRLSEGGKEGAQLDFYPMVSFVMITFNEENCVEGRINGLFSCASRYPGLCEVIMVDDGSTDSTYEIAWAAMELNRRRWLRTGGRLIRHMTTLGRTESVKTGVNRAYGQLIVVVNGVFRWGPYTLKELIERMASEGKKAILCYERQKDENDDGNHRTIPRQLEHNLRAKVSDNAELYGGAAPAASNFVVVYDAEFLRRILNDRESSRRFRNLGLVVKRVRTVEQQPARKR